MGKLDIKKNGIYMIDFGNKKRNVKGGIRPGLVISIDLKNAHSNVIMVVPITKVKPKHLENTYVADVFLERTKRNNLRIESVVQCGEIQSVDRANILSRMGTLDDEKKGEVNEALLRTMGFCFPCE